MLYNDTIKVKPYISSFRTINFTRPEYEGQQRLYYNKEPLNMVRKLVMYDVTNIEISFVIWKWSKSSKFANSIPKDEFIRIFQGNGRITKSRVSAFLNSVLNYTPGYRTNPTGKVLNKNGETVIGRISRTNYRFHHRLELQYACEFAMLCWMPWARELIDGEETILTGDDFEEELVSLGNTSLEEFREMYIQELINRGMKWYR